MGTFTATYFSRQSDDTINPADDPIKSKDDPIKSKDDPIKSESDPIKSKDDPIKLELSEQIYELITRNPGINRETIAKTVGKSVETVKRVLKKLRNSKHRIEFLGSKKTGGYYLIKKQDPKIK